MTLFVYPVHNRRRTSNTCHVPPSPGRRSPEARMANGARLPKKRTVHRSCVHGASAAGAPEQPAPLQRELLRAATALARLHALPLRRECSSTIDVRRRRDALLPSWSAAPARERAREREAIEECSGGQRSARAEHEGRTSAFTACAAAPDGGRRACNGDHLSFSFLLF